MCLFRKKRLKMKALVIGIDYYDSGNSLNGCVRDAERIARLLEYNYNDEKNFDVKLLCATDNASKITKKQLKSELNNLFVGNTTDTILFYFAGHGYIDESSSGICTSELEIDGKYNFTEISTLINKAKAINKIVILDSCCSGDIGHFDILGQNSVLPENTTFITACVANGYAKENGLGGVFTNLLIDGLNGGAANMLGEITPSSLYAYIDRSLGEHEQRPVFKTNTQSFVCVRKVKPKIDKKDLKKLIEWFEYSDSEYKLDPTYEPQRGDIEYSNVPSPIEKHTKIFATLQNMVKCNLVEPICSGLPENKQHMYYAAMESKSCKLTLLGQHYWQLTKNKRF